MPYIAEPRRTQLGEDIHLPVPRTAGELNWMLTQVALRYLHQQPYGYAAMNDVVGALELAKQEFIARVVAPYERQKCAENGDVY